MKCSEKMMRYTGYLHIVALVVSIYGTYAQIKAVKTGKPFSMALIEVNIFVYLDFRNLSHNPPSFWQNNLWGFHIDPCVGYWSSHLVGI